MHRSNALNLFTPITLGVSQLKNRMVMAPMTRNRASPEGVPQEMNVLYYAQRAGAGLIITEGSPISPQGIGYPFTPGIYTETQIIGWEKVTTAVHKKGGIFSCNSGMSVAFPTPHYNREMPCPCPLPISSRLETP